MEKKYGEFKAYELININKISKLTGINKDKLYNNLKGVQQTLSKDQINEIKDITKEVHVDFNNVLDQMIHKIDEKTQKEIDKQTQKKEG